MNISPGFIPSRGGQAQVAALPQRNTFNPDNPVAPSVEDLSALDIAPAEDLDQAKLGEATKKFESHFMSELLKVMRRTIPEGGLFDKGFSQNTYTEMLDQEYSKLMTDHGGIGLAAMLERQFKQSPGSF